MHFVWPPSVDVFASEINRKSYRNFTQFWLEWLTIEKMQILVVCLQSLLIEHCYEKTQWNKRIRDHSYIT